MTDVNDGNEEALLDFALKVKKGRATCCYPCSNSWLSAPCGKDATHYRKGEVHLYPPNFELFCEDHGGDLFPLSELHVALEERPELIAAAVRIARGIRS